MKKGSKLPGVLGRKGKPPSLQTMSSNGHTDFSKGLKGAKTERRRAATLRQASGAAARAGALHRFVTLKQLREGVRNAENMKLNVPGIMAADGKAAKLGRLGVKPKEVTAAEIDAWITGQESRWREEGAATSNEKPPEPKKYGGLAELFTRVKKGTNAPERLPEAASIETVGPAGLRERVEEMESAPEPHWKVVKRRKKAGAKVMPDGTKLTFLGPSGDAAVVLKELPSGERFRVEIYHDQNGGVAQRVRRLRPLR